MEMCRWLRIRSLHTSSSSHSFCIAANALVAPISVKEEEGARLFAAGDAADEMYVLVSGQVEVSDGDRVVGTVGVGECLGEVAFLNEEPHTASASAGSRLELGA